MKINIAFIAPSPGLGGGNRKYSIYFKHLDPNFFNASWLIFDSQHPDKFQKNPDDSITIGSSKLLEYLRDKKIHFLQTGISLPSALLAKIRDLTFLLLNISFAASYSENPRDLNLIISKTEFWKRKFLNKGKPLHNSFVIFNPIDVPQWLDLKKTAKPIHRDFFKGKKVKFIIGRLARAEPSKWNFLILKSLKLLETQNQLQNFGFIFAGMPLLFKKALQLSLSKKSLQNILFLPEMKPFSKLAEFYQSIDLFWQTSLIGESFGNVIAEAACFSVPTMTDFKQFLNPDATVDFRNWNKKYDTQIELVDHGKNGAVCNFPQTVSKFLNSQDKISLRLLGSHALSKAKSEYHIQKTNISLAKTLHNFLVSKSLITPDPKFSKLKFTPTPKEVADFKRIYLSKIIQAIKANQITPLQKFSFRFQSKIWHAIEFIYLVWRKFLLMKGTKIEQPSI